jgi:hypothetical protein
MEMIWKRLETILRQKRRVEGFIISILDCGLWKHKKCKVEKNEINIHIERIDNDENTELLELHYLFYDGYN